MHALYWLVVVNKEADPHGRTLNIDLLSAKSCCQSSVTVTSDWKNQNKDSMMLLCRLLAEPGSEIQKDRYAELLLRAQCWAEEPPEPLAKMLLRPVSPLRHKAGKADWEEAQGKDPKEHGEDDIPQEAWKWCINKDIWLLLWP